MGLALLLLQITAATPQSIPVGDPRSPAPAPVHGRDSIVLEDGRVVRGTVRRSEDGLYLVLPHGELLVPPDQIKEVFVDPVQTHALGSERGGRSGYVYFEGQWMRRERRDQVMLERRRAMENRLEELAAHHSFDDPWVRDTPHFAVKTNTSPELLDRYSGLLEDLYDEFDRRWKLRRRSTAARRSEVRIFADRDQYLDSGAPPSTSGLFDPLSRVLTLYHDRSDPRYSEEVLLHEGTHLLTDLMRPEFLFPVWLSEGLAEYYSTARRENGRLVAGAVQEGRLAVWRKALEEGRALPLERLLATDRTRFGGLHYAAAWSFVHFLMETPAYQTRFLSFFKQLANGRGLNEVGVSLEGGVVRRTVRLAEARDLLLRHLRQRDLDELEAKWKDYVLHRLPESGPRGWVVAGRLHYRDRQLNEAEQALTRAIDMGSRDPTAPLLLARIHAMRELWEPCAAAFRASLELDPLNAEIHFEFGQSLSEADGVRESLRVEAIRHLFLAHELDPVEPRYRAVCARFSDL